MTYDDVRSVRQLAEQIEIDLRQLAGRVERLEEELAERRRAGGDQG